MISELFIHCDEPFWREAQDGEMLALQESVFCSSLRGKVEIWSSLISPAESPPDNREAMRA